MFSVYKPILLHLSEKRKKDGGGRERESERKQRVKGLTEGENTAFRLYVFSGGVLRGELSKSLSG